jgi:hypothetical protein
MGLWATPREATGVRAILTFCQLLQKDTIRGLFRATASVFNFGRDPICRCSNAVHATTEEALMESPFLGDAAIFG